MPVGAASWSFTEDDFNAITTTLQHFLVDSSARCALLVDRTGQLVATVGEQPKFDPTTFATLTAADFSAIFTVAKFDSLGSFVHESAADNVPAAPDVKDTSDADADAASAPVCVSTPRVVVDHDSDGVAACVFALVDWFVALTV